MPQTKDKTTGRFSPMVLDENMLRQKHLVERKSSREIAKDLGGDISSMTVYRVLKQLGIYQPIHKAISQEERAKILKLYVEERKSTPEVATELGISTDRVNVVVKKAGVRRNHVESNAIRFENYYAESDDILIKKYIEERKSISEIESGMRGDVGSRLRKLGLARSVSDANFNRFQGRTVKIDEGEICRLYIDEKLSTEEIANMLGISAWVVWSRLKKNGVVLRNYVDAGVVAWQRPGYRNKIMKVLEDNRHCRSLSEDETALMIKKYVEEGKTVAQVSEEMHIDAYTKLRKLGLLRTASEALTLKCYGRVINIDENKIKTMYVDSKMPIGAIAKEIGVSPGPVHRAVNRLGIVRSKAEAANLGWQNPEVMKKYWESLRRKPNVEELHVDEVIQEHFPQEFEYNGGYELGIAIERKVPDWVHINGDKRLIEYNGCFFHSCEKCGYEMMRNGRTAESIRQRDKRKLEVFSKHGFQTLVIWGHDADEEIIDKVRAFVSDGENVNKEYITNES